MRPACLLALAPRARPLRRRAVLAPSAPLRTLFASPMLPAKEKSGPVKKKIKLSEKEFTERASPLLFKPSATDLELPDLIETPTALCRVTEKDGKMVVGEEVLDFSLFNLALGGDIRKLDNVTYRKDLARFVHRVGSFQRLFPALLNPFMPRINLLVEYEAEQLVYWGVEYPPKLVATKPKVSWNALSTRIWTLIMIGEAGKGKRTKYDHWIVGNIPSNQIHNGEVLSEFIPAVPLPNAGLQRYSFILCQQNDKVDFSSFKKRMSSDVNDRAGFNLREFLTEYKLTPKGLVWMHMKADATVPGLYDGFDLDLESDASTGNLGYEVDADGYRLNEDGERQSIVLSMDELLQMHQSASKQ